MAACRFSGPGSGKRDTARGQEETKDRNEGEEGKLNTTQQVCNLDMCGKTTSELATHIMYVWLGPWTSPGLAGA